MSNDYYNATSQIGRLSRGSSSVINGRFTAVAAGFEKLPGEAALNQNRVTWVTDTGAANAVVVALTPAVTSYVDGLDFSFRLTNSLTGAATLDAGGGVRSLVDFTGSALQSGDFLANDVLHVKYDATGNVFRCLTPHRRTSMGLGTMSSQNADSVVITGGSITTTGNIISSGTTPAITLSETDGTPGYSQTNLVQSNDLFGMQTLTSAGAFVATDYIQQKGASGAVNHRWYIDGTEQMRFDANGLGINGFAAAPLDVKETTNNNVIQASNTSGTFTASMLALTATATSGYNFLEASSNAGADPEFILDAVGNGSCDGAWTGGGADRAEAFEWVDGNPSNQDRAGIAVVLVNGKIREARRNETPLGVISYTYDSIGNAAPLSWVGKHDRDAFGRAIEEDFTLVEWMEDREGEAPEKMSMAEDAVPPGKRIPENAIRTPAKRRRLAAGFDPTQKYIPRLERKEWDPVGILGICYVKDGQEVAAHWKPMGPSMNGARKYFIYPVA